MKVLILGGLGFVGGHIATFLSLNNCEVTVIDGCLPETGGGDGLWDDINLYRVIRRRVEEIDELPEYLQDADVIVDAMGWTKHMLALKNPSYDLELNVSSHLHVIKSLSKNQKKKIIYLGSRGQYGNPQVAEINEETPQIPEDIQGIHKVAAESHWRQISKRFGHTVISLRFGNTYGARQPMDGSDIGLLGGFIRSLMKGETVELFGRGRTRAFIAAEDIAQAVWCCLNYEKEGFTSFNLASEEVSLELALEILISQLGQGEYRVVDFPKEEKVMDVGLATFSGETFKKTFPSFKMTPIDEGLNSTIKYIIEN